AKTQAEWKRLHLDARGITVVAEQRVPGFERDRIHRARRADTEAAYAETAEVLNSVERVARQDFDHNSIRSTVNRTGSPGAMSEGLSHRGSTTARGAQPIAFQPFGLFRAATPVCIPPIVTEPARMLSDGTDLRGMKMRGSRPWR